MGVEADRPEVPIRGKMIIKNYGIIKLLSDGEFGKKELASRLDVSPKTIYRRTRELREQDLVERRNNSYRLTTVGDIYAGVLLTLSNLSETIDDCQGHVLNMDRTGLPPYWLFLDSDVHYPSNYSTVDPAELLKNHCRNSTTIRGFSSVVDSALLSELEGTGSTIVLESKSVKRTKKRCPETYHSIVSSDKPTYRVANSKFSFGLFLPDRSEMNPLLPLYDTQRVLRVLLVLKTRRAIGWANQCFAETLAESTPLSDR